jgi:hypothetical protein
VFVGLCVVVGGGGVSAIAVSYLLMT